MIEPSSKRRKGGVSHKELQRLKTIAYGGETVLKDVITTADDPDYDPWAATLELTDNQDPSFSFLEPPKACKAPKTLKEPPISLVANGKDVPAIKKPKAGISYNPVFQDWDQLLTEEGEKEVEAEGKRLREAEEERQRLEKIAAAQEEEDNYAQTEDESAWEGFESEYEGEEWLTKRRPERKTPAQRNKAIRRKEAERQARWEAQMKKRAQQAEQIKAIAKAVEARAKDHSQVSAQAENESDSEVDDRKLRRRKFGKNPYVSHAPTVEAYTDQCTVFPKPLLSSSSRTNYGTRSGCSNQKVTCSKSDSATFSSEGRWKRGGQSRSRRRRRERIRRNGRIRISRYDPAMVRLRMCCMKGQRGRNE